MEFIVGIVSSIVGQITQFAVVPIKSRIGYMFNHGSQVRELKDQVEKLTSERERVQHRVEDAQKKGELIEPHVNKWLDDVNKVAEGAEKAIEDEDKQKKFLLFPNLKSRYRVGKKIEKEAKGVAKLLEQDKFVKVSYRVGQREIGSPPLRGYEAFESRKVTLERIMEDLKDSNVTIIGVHGMPGVGKTMLMKEIRRKAREEQLFDEVAMATVSDNPKVRSIQGEIADKLDLSFVEESVSGRAARLYHRLRSSKVLVILDDIWTRLDLDEMGIGISFEDEKNFRTAGSKILLTSRNQDVLCHMNAKRKFEIGLLSEEEAMTLFAKIVGDRVENPDYLPIATKLLEKSAGLPVAILAIANALKNKGLHVWEDALQQLRSSNPANIEGIYAGVYSTIELSYKYLRSEEAKSLLQLCAWAPPDLQTYVPYLVRTSLSLGLLSGINTLTQARNRVKALLDELTASSLLLNSDKDEYVEMHDVVRDVSMFIAAKDKQMFVREEAHMKELLKKGELNNCVAISLHTEIHELPHILGCPKLSVLSLWSKNPLSEVPENFFQKLKELKVLQLGEMSFSSLPRSLPTNFLQALYLDKCKLDDIATIGELKKLDTLSLRGSDIANLPREIGQLTQLRSLDLSNCFKLEVIPKNVVSNLTCLEELYMGNSFNRWEVEGNANLAELKHLCLLSTLEVHIPHANVMPKDLFSGERLDRYRIFIGDDWHRSNKRECSRTLKLGLHSCINLDHGIKMLLRKTEALYVNGLKCVNDVLYEFDDTATDSPHLKNLRVHNSSEIQYIINPTGGISHEAFPFLETLVLKNLTNLKEIFYDGVCVESFRKLKIIKVGKCDKLKNLFSFSLATQLVNLEKIEVTDCMNVIELFASKHEQENEAAEKIELRQLQSMTLRHLPELICFCFKERNHSLSLFSEKMLFPCLENLRLSSINIEGIWQKQLSTTSYSIQNLRSLIIEGCGNLKYLLSDSMARHLVHLTYFEITECKSLREVIYTEDIEEEDKATIFFLQLYYVKISNLQHLMRFCSESQMIEFPSLRLLEIENCPKLKGFTHKSIMEENNQHFSTQALFNEKVAFPRLKDLRIVGMGSLKMLWHVKQTLNSFCEINFIKVESCARLLTVFPCNMMERLDKLQEVHIRNCDSLEQIIGPHRLNCSNSDERTTQSMVDEPPIKIIFPEVKFLLLDKLPKLKGFYSKIHSTQWPSLLKLRVSGCNKVEIFAGEHMSYQAIQGNSQHATQSQQPLFRVNKDTFPCLELVRLESDTMKEIWHGRLPTPYLSKLKVLKLFQFPSCCITLPAFIQSLSNLETLILSNASFGQVFPCKGFNHQLEEHAWALGRLRELRLSKLPELTQIWNEESYLTTAFYKLETLQVQECGKLNFLAPSSMLFKRLTTLEISRCDGLINLFTHSTVRSMVKLTRMSVTDCQMIEEIIASGGDEVNDGIIFSQLKSLELDCLSSLSSFCSANYTFEFPSLEEVILRNCPKMKIFSQGESSAPSLQKVQFDKDREHWNGDLNTTMEQIFNELNLQNKVVCKLPKLDDEDVSTFLPERIQVSLI